MAAAFKSKGNEFFKSGDYAAAIGAYTSAIMADPSDVTFPLNRAAAYLKLAKYHDAERDCTRVLSKDPKNLKALFRRGQARAGQENLIGAKTDLEQLLSLTPNDPAAKTELAKVQAQLKRTTNKGTKPVPEVVPFPTPYRRRVPIEIVDTPNISLDDKKVDQPSENVSIEEISTPGVNSNRTAKTAHSTTRKGPLIEEIPIASPTTSSTEVPPATAKTFQKAKQERASRTVGGGIMKRDGSHSSNIFTPKAVVPSSTKPASATSPSIDSEAASKLVNGSGAGAKQQFPKPTNAFEFQRQWHSETDHNSRWSILQTIPPENLPTFFKNSMEPPLLASIIAVLYTIASHSSDARGLAASYLHYTRKIARFETLILFFSDVEQKTMENLSGLVPSS